MSSGDLRERVESPFGAALERALARRGMTPSELCPQSDALARRVLEEYGAMYVAAPSVEVPTRCVFETEEEVERFQRAAGWRAEDFGGETIELQPAAMESLLGVRAEAGARGLTITPRGGREAARRSFADTLRLWDSRCRPAIEHWSSRGELSEEEAERLRRLTMREQVAAVLECEERGVYFSKDFKKSILQSVAAPGASQHLAMLAFDVEEFQDARVRALFERHGWFQTVRRDLPHFTFLGLAESELPARGLRRVKEHTQNFWVPDVGRMKDEG